jgi:hypothetical protein
MVKGSAHSGIASPGLRAALILPGMLGKQSADNEDQDCPQIYRIFLLADVPKKGRKRWRFSCQVFLFSIQYTAVQSSEVSIVTFGIAVK